MLGMVTQPAATGQSGVALPTQPAVRLRGADGAFARLAGVTIAAATTTAGVTLANATATTNANGVAAFSGLTLTGTAGPYVLRFSAAGLTDVDAAALAIGAGPPAQLAFATPPPAAGASGVILPAVVVQLADQSGNPSSVTGIQVTASLTGATGAAVFNGSAVSDAVGRATFGALALAGTAGAYVLRFAAAGLTAVDAPLPLQLGPGAATALAVTVQPGATAVNGGTLVSQPVVRVRDAWGNTVDTADVVVHAGVTSGTPALAGDSAVTDPAGLASFTALGLTGIAGPYTLRFSAPGLQPAVAATQTVLAAGQPTRLLVTTQPALAVDNGSVLSPQPVVQVADSIGNAVAVAGVTVNATLQNAGATITAGASATTDAQGAAVFSGLAMTGLVGAYRLIFDAAGLYVPDSATIPTILDPGPLAQLLIVTAPPAAAQQGVALSPQPAVRLADASGNLILVAGTVVAASTTGATATVSAGATATTNANGVATFSGLALMGPAGSHTLQFSVGAVTVAAATATVLGP